MGIRYYAYAFDHELSDRALSDPRSLISSDPLADAWGLEPHSAVGYTTFEQAVPERDLLYLDKAWRELQFMTGPRWPGAAARPSFAMFEGEVVMGDTGWDPWVRPLLPESIPVIERDLAALVDGDASRILRDLTGAENVECRHATQYLRRAHEFVTGLVRDNRGMVYMIG